jgi:hypothetical protein
MSNFRHLSMQQLEVKATALAVVLEVYKTDARWSKHSGARRKAMEKEAETRLEMKALTDEILSRRSVFGN